MTNTLNDETISTPPRDAATVILIKDGAAGLEVLLLCRGNSRTVMNQAWVFPGGKVDDADFEHEAEVLSQLSAQPQNLLAEDIPVKKACALFQAAVRETSEETSVVLTAGAVHPWSRWITPNEPSMMKKRFDARFFVAALPDGQTAIHDGSEATDSNWITPRQALQDYLDHKITLAPPQIMTLVALCTHATTASCIDQANRTPTYCIQPQVLKSSGNHKRILLYPGDREHSDSNKLMPGPTRLLWQDGYFEPEEGFEQYLQ
jgi:8-oxo-dGTP pyrophosphatase MutT (NUDIX family)